MEQEPESAVDDYYILFRDTNAPAPTSDVYEKRREQGDLLLADTASYVWGYAGKLTVGQMFVAQAAFTTDFRERFNNEHEHLVAPPRAAFAFVFTPLEPGAFDSLARVSPNLAFLSNVPPKHRVLFFYYPKTDDECEQIKQALLSSHRIIDGYFLTLTIEENHFLERFRHCYTVFFTELLSCHS